MEEEQNLVIPLVEERVTATKREVETGRVRVTTKVREREEMARAELVRDEVDVVRIPRGEEVAALPEIRHEGDTTIIPVVEERLFVEKRLFLVEEIHLRRTRSTEEFAQPVTVARQWAEIVRDTSGGGQPEVSKE